MGYLKIYRLERFFYDTVKKRIFECINLKEINELYGRPGAVTIAEVFSKELEEEEGGKKFEYNIRGFIIPNADKYLTVYEQARQKAFSDYLFSRKGEFRTKKENGDQRRKKQVADSSTGGAAIRLHRKRYPLSAANRKSDKV